MREGDSRLRNQYDALDEVAQQLANSPSLLVMFYVWPGGPTKMTTQMKPFPARTIQGILQTLNVLRAGDTNILCMSRYSRRKNAI